MKIDPLENVVNFSQTESTAKKFRNDLPISDELKEVLLTKIFGDFAKEVIVAHLEDCQKELKDFIDEHHPQEDKKSSLEHNLFWWSILYQVSKGIEVTFVKNYIEKNYVFLKNKPVIISWLKEWEKAVTKFYYVGYKYNDQVLVLVDILTEQTVDVIVYDRDAIPPKQGEIVMGTLIPIGAGLYFPIIDFYHFEYEARVPIAQSVKHYYDQYLKSCTMQEAFLHVLSDTLQIENIILTEKKRNITLPSSE